MKLTLVQDRMGRQREGSGRKVAECSHLQNQGSCLMYGQDVGSGDRTLIPSPCVPFKPGPGPASGDMNESPPMIQPADELALSLP